MLLKKAHCLENTLTDTHTLTHFTSKADPSFWAVWAAFAYTLKAVCPEPQGQRKLFVHVVSSRPLGAAASEARPRFFTLQTPHPSKSSPASERNKPVKYQSVKINRKTVFSFALREWMSIF